MKLLKAILLVPALLALLAGSALAKPAAPKSGIDPSFGHGGKIALSVPKESVNEPFQTATAPSNKSYALTGRLLLAFGANGRPDLGFGHNGRIQVAAAAGETTEVDGLAVDAQGRILVSGSVDPTPGVPNKSVPEGSGLTFFLPPPSNAFIVRYLPDGERDPTFGGAGEIDVNLTPPAAAGTTPHVAVPVVHSDRLAIAGNEQPVLGGTYWYYGAACYSGGAVASGFVAPVDPAGGGAQNLPPTVYAPTALNAVSKFAPMPNGNLAALSYDRYACGHGGAGYTSLSVLNYGSQSAPALDPTAPHPYLWSLAVDTQGRFLGIESPGTIPFNSPTESSKVVRLLPNGEYDPSFGSDGGLPLKKFGEESIGGVVVDSKSRPIVAGGDGKFRLVRLTEAGKIDQSFAQHGWLEIGFGQGTKASPKAIAIDAKGRLLVAGLVTDPALKSGVGIALTRVLPGS